MRINRLILLFIIIFLVIPGFAVSKDEIIVPELPASPADSAAPPPLESPEEMLKPLDGSELPPPPVDKPAAALPSAGAPATTPATEKNIAEQRVEAEVKKKPPMMDRLLTIIGIKKKPAEKKEEELVPPPAEPAKTETKTEEPIVPLAVPITPPAAPVAIPDQLPLTAPTPVGPAPVAPAPTAPAAPETPPVPATPPAAPTAPSPIQLPDGAPTPAEPEKVMPNIVPPEPEMPEMIVEPEPLPDVAPAKKKPVKKKTTAKKTTDKKSATKKTSKKKKSGKSDLMINKKSGVPEAEIGEEEPPFEEDGIRAQRDLDSMLQKEALQKINPVVYSYARMVITPKLPVDSDADVVQVSLRVKVEKGSNPFPDDVIIQEPIGENEGLVYMFESTRIIRLYLDQFFVSRDFVFLNDRGKVVEIRRGVKNSDEPLKTIREARYLLQLPEGNAKKYGIKIGDTATLESAVKIVK